MKGFRTKRGFTLVELLLTIALLGILAIGIGPPVASSVQQYALVRARRQMVAQSQTAMERMIREIRLVQNASHITSVSSSSSFTFQYPPGTSITYDLSGTNLRRNSNILAENVSALSMTYFDEGGGVTSVAANVRRVRIQMTVDPPGSTGTLTLRSSTFIRSLGNNYGTFEIQ